MMGGFHVHPKAGPALARRLESAEDYDVFEVDIFLREEPAKEVISSLEGAADSEGRESRINVIRRATEVSQRPLLEFLEGAQRELASRGRSRINSASEQRRIVLDQQCDQSEPHSQLLAAGAGPSRREPGRACTLCRHARAARQSDPRHRSTGRAQARQGEASSRIERRLS